jgi:hypothetical protein
MDKVIDLNSIGAVKQYVRDLEAGLEDLEDASAVAAGHVRTVQREADQLRSQINELNTNIDFILSDSKPENDYLATPLEARLIGLEQRMITKNEELEAAQRPRKPWWRPRQHCVPSTWGWWRRSSVGGHGHRRQGQGEGRRRHSASREDRLLRRDVSIDAVSDRIQRRADVADARFERALGDMTDTVEKDVVVAQAQARLEARKAKLAAQSAESS